MFPRASIAGLLAVLVVLLAGVASAGASARGEVAALQVALRAAGVYEGTVDGVRGPGTTAALQALQRLAALPADGVVGERTRRALGPRGRHPYGSRPMRAGDVGWDVAALQFELARHGFPSATFDGVLGPHVREALKRFQARAGLSADGVAGHSTLVALRAPPPVAPVRLLWPLAGATVGDRYGPRGARFHAGIDLPAASGTTVTTAGFGTVAFAGASPAGWGNMVIIRHRFGLRSLYAHLSSIDVRPGQFVGAGVPLGRVGATGAANGPHLHFELLLRGANVNPLTALG